jgi:hypothetical protein
MWKLTLGCGNSAAAVNLLCDEFSPFCKKFLDFLKMGSQIWLNKLMDYLHLNNIKQLKKKKY